MKTIIATLALILSSTAVMATPKERDEIDAVVCPMLKHNYTYGEVVWEVNRLTRLKNLVQYGQTTLFNEKVQLGFAVITVNAEILRTCPQYGDRIP